MRPSDGDGGCAGCGCGCVVGDFGFGQRYAGCAVGGRGVAVDAAIDGALPSAIDGSDGIRAEIADRHGVTIVGKVAELKTLLFGSCRCRKYHTQTRMSR